MSSTQHPRRPSLRRRGAVLGLAGSTCALALLGGASTASATRAPSTAAPAVVAIGAPQLLGQVTLPSGASFRGTAFGGLSGITYDARRGVYYAISDDRSQLDAARFYTLRIDLTNGPLQAGVEVLSTTPLRNARGNTFPESSLDPESIALTGRRTLVISSEGDASRGVAPFVREFDLHGAQVATLPVPRYYRPAADGSAGIRNNLALESGGITQDRQRYFTATENALAQDGTAATPTTGSPSRLLRYRLSDRRLQGEFVYEVETVKQPPVPADAFATNGLVDLLPLSYTRLLALERGFSTGVGNTARLYEVDLDGATNVRHRAALPADLAGVTPVSKTLVLDLASLGITLDNLEGLTFGPRLADGRRSVVLVSDDNFSATQQTQFLFFAV